MIMLAFTSQSLVSWQIANYWKINDTSFLNFYISTADIFACFIALYGFSALLTLNNLVQTNLENKFSKTHRPSMAICTQRILEYEEKIVLFVKCRWNWRLKSFTKYEEGQCWWVLTPTVIISKQRLRADSWVRRVSADVRLSPLCQSMWPLSPSR